MTEVPPISLPAATLIYLARAQSVGKAAAWVGVGVGTAAAVGWALDSPALKGALGTPITIKANTALCMVLAGVAIRAAFESAGWARRLSQVLSLIHI